MSHLAYQPAGGMTKLIRDAAACPSCGHAVLAQRDRLELAFSQQVALGFPSPDRRSHAARRWLGRQFVRIGARLDAQDLPKETRSARSA